MNQSSQTPPTSTPAPKKRWGWLLLQSTILFAALLVWVGGEQRLLYGQSSAKDRQLQRWSRELVKLRSEVDVLANKVKLERTQSLLSLRSLALRQQQLQLQVDSDNLRLRGLKDKAERFLKRSLSRKSRQKAMVSLVEKHLTATQRVLKQTIPFRRKERVAQVTRILQKLKAGQLDATQSATRLWKVLSDELRMSTLVERTEVPITLPNESAPRLMQAIRLGTYALFLRLPKGGWGRILRSKSTWNYEDIKNRKGILELDRLYHDLERQKRDGFYELPLGPQQLSRP